jgi:hypothetical protein
LDVEDHPSRNVPIDNSLRKSISLRIHKCDICDDRLGVIDDLENQIDIIKEIDDSYESEYEKHEPKLLLCNYCQKEYLIPSYT